MALADLANFNAELYLQQNPDVAAGWGASPLDHWLMYGQAEGRPFPQTEATTPTSYAAMPAGYTPMQSYFQDIAPSLAPLDFDEEAYLANNPDITPETWSASPYEHWLMYGQKEGRAYPYQEPLPSTVQVPGWDLRYYEQTIRDLEASGVPLYSKEGADGTPLLSTIQHDQSWNQVQYPIDWSLYEDSRGTRLAGLGFQVGAGIMLGAAGGAAASALGATGAATGAAGGATAGAGGAALQGENVGEGALLGGLVGGVYGAYGPSAAYSGEGVDAGGAGEFNTEYTAPDPLSDPYYDYSTFNPDSPLNQTAIQGTGPTGSGPSTISDLAPAAGPIANALTSEGGSNSLPYLPDGTTDLARLLGATVPALVGAYASNEQAQSLEDLANKYMEFGAPSRARYEASYAPGFSMANDPGYTDALDQATKSFLHKASIDGNPADSPNAWEQTLTDVNAKFAYPALKDYRQTNASAGGLASFAAAAPDIEVNAIGAGKNVWDAFGVGASNIFNPPRQRSLSDLLKEAGY